MSNFINNKFQKLVHKVLGTEKQFAEIRFWEKQVKNYLDWYNGKIPELFGNPPPKEKIKAHKPEHAALLTFFEIHQKPKYLKDLLLAPNSFENMKVLDVGSGPFPSALCFTGCEIYNLDPLHDRYLSAGYPTHYYEQRARFVMAPAEDMPFDDGFIDAVISVNAIDHVDNFAKAAMEIRRVLRPGGKFRMHVHYHPKTTAEPIELNDDVFLKNYGWVNGLKKIQTSKEKMGHILTSDDELYVVWGN
jgi:SAM-dependent methyltransferase